MIEYGDFLRIELDDICPFGSYQTDVVLNLSEGLRFVDIDILERGAEYVAYQTDGPAVLFLYERRRGAPLHLLD